MLGAGYTMVNETTELYLMEKYTNLKNKSMSPPNPNLSTVQHQSYGNPRGTKITF